MAQKTMYPTIIGDYTSALTAPFEAGTDTTVSMWNTEFLPDPSSDGNSCTITSKDKTYLVTVKYTGKTNTTLTGVSVIQGTPASALTATYEIGCEVSKPLAQDDVQSIQDNIRDLSASKLDNQYTSAQDGYVAKVDPTDHKLKVMAGSSSAVLFGDILGQPTDNANLATALNGKQDKITSESKLSADLVDDTTTTNKFVSASDKTAWNGKVAGVTLNGTSVVDESKVAVLTTIDNVASTSQYPLSANQGKVLNDRIDAISSIGRYLSHWNCATGLPTTNPTTSPYTYHTGDYFVISVVDDTTNYMPDGSTYTIGVASTTVTTEDVAPNDIWRYDGTNWQYEYNHPAGTVVTDVTVGGQTVVSGGVATIPTASAAETGALSSTDWSTFNGKQNALTFDSTPTASSTNPVTSGGIKTYADGKVAINQGVSHAGEVLKVGADGNVTTGTAGTSDYNDLTNRPRINSVTLTGNKYADDLDLVSTNTDQTLTSKKVFSYTEPVVLGGQDSIVKILSTHETTEITEPMWTGRIMVGNRNKTFLMGVYRPFTVGAVPICGLGAHSWSDSFEEEDAAWEDVYIQPDGDKACYIGGRNWTANSGWFKVQNTGNSNASFKAYINSGTDTSPIWRTILPNMNSSASSVFITPNVSNSATYNYCVSIGHGATPSNTYATSIGYVAKAGSHGVAIGSNSVSSGEYAIQIGYGTNSTANTMSVGLSSSLNVQLLDSTGKIPYARLPIPTPPATGTYVLKSVDGVLSWVSE